MCGKKEEDQQATGECSRQSIHNNNIQGYHHHQDHHQLFLQQQHHQHQLQLQHQYNTTTDPYAGDGSNTTTGKAAAGLIFPNEVSPILQWALPPVHNSFNNPVHHDPFLVPPPPNTSYSGLFNRTRSAASALQFAYHHEGPSSDHHHHHLRILSDPSVLGASSIQPCSSPFALQAELGKLTAQEIMDAKALAASKSHSEAERRRRERINNHLAKLRSMLPSTTKTDKASLLAEVIQHVKELKRQTSQIAEASPVPTETDELVVDTLDEEGRFLIKASLCCEDRSDLLPDLIKTLKALRLRTLKAEITTLGGRVKNVLVITGEDEETNNNNNSNIDQQAAHQQLSISSIQDALKAVMERTANDDDSPGSVKRQRTNISMIEHKSI